MQCTCVSRVHRAVLCEPAVHSIEWRGSDEINGRALFCASHISALRWYVPCRVFTLVPVFAKAIPQSMKTFFGCILRAGRVFAARCDSCVAEFSGIVRAAHVAKRSSSDSVSARDIHGGSSPRTEVIASRNEIGKSNVSF